MSIILLILILVAAAYLTWEKSDSKKSEQAYKDYLKAAQHLDETIRRIFEAEVEAFQLQYESITLKTEGSWITFKTRMTPVMPSIEGVFKLEEKFEEAENPREIIKKTLEREINYEGLVQGKDEEFRDFQKRFTETISEKLARKGVKVEHARVTSISLPII